MPWPMAPSFMPKDRRILAALRGTPPSCNHELRRYRGILGTEERARRRTRIMIEWSERKAYWRNTKVQMLTSLLPFLLALLVLPLYAEVLNDKRIFGIALGYFLACHGLIVIAFVTTAVFV